MLPLFSNYYIDNLKAKSVLNKFRTPLLLLLFLLINNAVKSQYLYRGKITNKNNGKTILGATIDIPSEDDFTFTNILGKFEFESKFVDSLKVIISRKNYEQVELTIHPYEFAEVQLQPIHRGKETVKLIEELPLNDFNFDNTFTIIKPTDIDVGLSQDAAILLQHRLPGFTVTRSGNDPNEFFHIYNRGISSATHRNYPLVIIDGIPEMSLEFINPDDIESIATSNSAIGGSQYGIMGGAGIIEIKTKRFKEGSPKVRYHIASGISFMQNALPIMHADEYLEFKPNYDHGATTNWIETITRTAISHRHHLSFTNRLPKGTIYASLGYDNNNGILKESGYQQGNARINMQNASRNGKTIFTSAFSFMQRDANYSNKSSFWEAHSKNPTIPVYDENGELTVEPGWELDMNNPLGIILENAHLARTRDATFSLKADQATTKNNTWQYLLAFRNRRIHAGQTRITFGPTLDYNEFNRKHFIGSIKSNQQIKKENSTINIQPGIESSLLFEQYRNFHRGVDVELVTFKNLMNPKNTFNNVYFDDNDLPKKIISGFINADLKWQMFTFDAGFRYDRVFQNDVNKGIVFFHSQIITDLLRKKINAIINSAELAVGFGKTGLPSTINYQFYFLENQRPYYLSGEYLSTDFLFNDFFNEFKTEINAQLNVNFFEDRLKTSINFYDNLLYNQIIGLNFSIGDLGNKGVELFLSYKNKKERKIEWTCDLAFNANKSILYRYALSGDPMTLAEATGLSHGSDIWIETYGEVGQLYGSTSNGNIENGRFLLEDKDGNNLSDLSVIGNAKPDYRIFMRHVIKMKKWDALISIRSIIGHNILNVHRYINEVVSTTGDNILKTKYFNEDRTQMGNSFSNIFVENASFLKLDFLSIGYSPTLKKGNLRIYLTANDLLTLTGYTGIDPEPDYEHKEFMLDGGKDTIYNYYRSRTFILGVQLSL